MSDVNELNQIRNQYGEGYANRVHTFAKSKDNTEEILELINRSYLPDIFNVQYGDVLHHLGTNFVEDNKISMDVNEKVFDSSEIVQCSIDEDDHFETRVIKTTLENVDIESCSFDGTLDSLVKVSYDIEHTSPRGTLDTVLYSNGMMVEPKLGNVYDFVEFYGGNQAFALYNGESLFDGSVFILLDNITVNDDGVLTAINFYPFVKENCIRDISSYYE